MNVSLSLALSLSSAYLFVNEMFERFKALTSCEVIAVPGSNRHNVHFIQ